MKASNDVNLRVQVFLLHELGDVIGIVVVLHDDVEVLQIVEQSLESGSFQRIFEPAFHHHLINT